MGDHITNMNWQTRLGFDPHGAVDSCRDSAAPSRPSTTPRERQQLVDHVGSHVEGETEGAATRTDRGLGDSMNAEEERAYVESWRAEQARKHAVEHPDGCPDWCAMCAERLRCRNGRHEWPRDYSDGDTCFCGEIYLFGNAVDERPRVVLR